MHGVGQSTSCLATNATKIAIIINKIRIKINTQVCSDTKSRNDNCELEAALLLALTERITAGVENSVLVLNGPVSVMLEPASSFVCRTAFTRTW